MLIAVFINKFIVTLIITSAYGSRHVLVSRASRSNLGRAGSSQLRSPLNINAWRVNIVNIDIVDMRLAVSSPKYAPPKIDPNYRLVARFRSDRTTLVIPSRRRTTLGDRAFPVTAARAWNALPSSVRSAPSLL